MKKNDIFITYGADAKQMTKALLKSVDLCALIGKNKDAYIGIKPNLVVSRPSSEGATTTPMVARTVVKYLKKHGYNNVCFIESSWIGDSTKRAIKACGYDKICEEFDVEFIDVKDDDYKVISIDGMDIEVSKEYLALDYVINIPVLKGHCQTKITCAIKNLKGCISDKSKRYFHTIGLHRPIAALASIRVADLVIVDSINGDLDFEEGGNPVQTNRMLAGIDSVLIDAYCANLLGYEAKEVKYIGLSEKYGVGSADASSANVIILNEPEHDEEKKSTQKVKKLEKYVEEKKACSACYANLIHALKKLKDEGELGGLPPIFIGQGYKGKCMDGVGIGKCCAKFESFVKGCPPKSVDIVKYIKKYK